MEMDFTEYPLKLDLPAAVSTKLANSSIFKRLQNIWLFDKDECAKSLYSKVEENPVWHPFFLAAWGKTWDLLASDDFKKSMLLVHIHKTSPFRTGSKLCPDFAVVSACDAQPGQTSTQVNAVVYFIEIKQCISTDERANLKQVLEYAERLLTANPLRTHAYGVLCDNTKIRVCRFDRAHDQTLPSMKLYPLAFLSTEAGQLQLASVMFATLDTLGFKPPFIVTVPATPPASATQILPSSLLGNGAFAHVYAARRIDSSEDVYALKCFQEKSRADVEVKALRALNDQKVLFVPSLVTSCQVETHFVVVVSPICHRFLPGIHFLSCMQFIELSETLRQAHAAGVCCRDVRPDNIMQLDGHAYLIDWNSAYFFLEDNSAQYEGTLRYASGRVLECLSKGQSQFAFTPADDLESLVRVAIDSVRS